MKGLVPVDRVSELIVVVTLIYAMSGAIVGFFFGWLVFA